MAIIDVEDVFFSFDAKSQPIIDGVSFKAEKGEFVSLVGPSGCGKSTLLRIIAGLIKPSSGKVLYNGNVVSEPTRKISFVFQDFALLPWLTNLDNVKIGLSYLNLGPAEKHKRAKELLERVGLGGLGHNYPNALSGGMKQRLGIARAIASDPEVLLMDEPFSSLDELTAESLRADVVYMLENKDLPVNAVIMVTHNVEEAAELSNKIIVLSPKPTHKSKSIMIKLPRPRNKRTREFSKIVDEVYAALAQR